MAVTHTAVFKAVAVTAQQDFFQVKASANSVVVVHGWVLSQNSEIGDAQEEMLQLTTNRATGTATDGSGGTTATVNLLMRGGVAFGGVVEVNNTTRLAVGTGTLTTDLETYAWNLRVPMVFWYTPEARPIIMPSDWWTLELETTVADTMNVSGTIYLEQIGI